MRFNLCTVSLSLLFIVNVLCLNAQKDKYNQPGNIPDIHTLFSYQKSNWDGSNVSQVFLYIKDTNQLESFKWSEGDKWSSLVTAGFSWKEFVVDKIQNHRIDAQGNKTLVAEQPGINQ